ncbi:uncharacterized protein LOC117328020 isoform X2 [Pecten maximus]|uniref:uncharacterized protein LOC117328020 isoform X2 n=1 Tax=Pecten maximus TaxID=6579 RepID=UPI001458B928|nr:uncharacterized protein LOC117328020 isoform X2 [Pecten maximus]
MAGYKDVVLVTLLYFVITSADDKTSTNNYEIQACYSKRFFPKCNDGERMALLDVRYGVKTQSAVCPSIKTKRAEQNQSCCLFQKGDCLVPMTKYAVIHQYYAAFSGYTVPLSQPKVVWRRIENDDNCTVGRAFSNFLSMKYQCISDDTLIIMADSASRSGQLISTMYPIIGGEDAREYSTCTVTGGQSGLDVYALDIRLECYTGYENVTCIGNHTLTFTDGEQTKKLVSETNTVLGQRHLIFSTNEASMTFTFQRDDGSRPQMVWFEVQSRKAAATITVRCNEPEVITPGDQTTSNTTSTANEPVDSLPIIIGVVIGVVVLLVVVIVIFRWYRRRSEKAEADALADYRRRIDQKNSDVQTKQVRPNDHNKAKHQKPKIEQKAQHGMNDQQRRKKFNINSPKGLETSMNDPVYHDVTIPSQRLRRAEDKH